MSNIINIEFNGGTSAVASDIVFRYDYGQQISFSDLDLPEIFEVHFANVKQGKSTTQIGSDGVVTIPDAYLKTGLPIYGWIYLHSTEYDGETEYSFRIPVKDRATPSDPIPTPEQATFLTQVVNLVTTKAGDAETSAQDAENSATIAAQQAQDAAAQATAAAGSVTQASAAAGSALAYANRADTAATAASGYANRARASAESIDGILEAVTDLEASTTQKANEAQNSATQASGSASTATTKAAEAAQSASSAATDASRAESYSTAAINAKTAAETAADNAEESATASATSASEAEASATASATSASEAEASAQAAAQSAASLVIDETLTEAGQAAEAKAVGDAVSDLKSELAEFGAIKNPYLYISASQIVSGTAPYVMKDIVVSGVVAGKRYTATVATVSGATNIQPVYIRFMDAGDNVLEQDASNQSFTNVIATGIAPTNTSYMVVRLYASKSGSGSVSATYNDIKVFEGDSVDLELTSNLANILAPQIDSIKNNVVLPKSDRVVSGTGTYVFEDIIITDIEPNTLYTAMCKKVIGGTYNIPVKIDALIGSTIERSAQNAQNQTENIEVSVMTSEQTTSVKVRLYASASGAATATFKEVCILKSVGSEFSREAHNYLTDNTIALNVPHIESQLIPTIDSIAHRGYWKFSTECLKKATINAKKAGFNWCENDLNITSDGQYVMWHDSNLAKVGLPNVNISNVTLAYLKALDLDGDEFLTFKEWVYLCKKLGLKMRVDTKITITDEIAEELIAIVREAGMLENVVWYAFLNYRLYDPHCTIGLVTKPTSENIESYSPYLNDGKVIFNPHISDITSETVALALNAGFEVECWTMEIDPIYGFNSHKAFVQAVSNAIDCGIQGVTCDNNTVYSILQEAGY